MFLTLFMFLTLLKVIYTFPFQPNIKLWSPKRPPSDQAPITTPTIKPAEVQIIEEITPKTVTKEIMNYFAQSTTIDIKKDSLFGKRILEDKRKENLDGLHILTILFQSARTKRIVNNILPSDFMLETLKKWNPIWSERDISTFVYGVRALECLDPSDGELLKFGASKIMESTVQLSSRAIGNALYGLRCITSDTTGITEICAALSYKIDQFKGDLSGQDIGIGLFGLQGMSAEAPEVRKLVKSLAIKIAASESELDAQALSNALYGLQV